MCVGASSSIFTSCPLPPPPESAAAAAASAAAAVAASLQSKLSEQLPAEKNRLQTQKPSAAPTYASQRMI
jgi:hypothetical protein